MRLLTFILAAAIVGSGVGAVWGYLEISPAASLPALNDDSLDSGQPAESSQEGGPRVAIDEYEHDFGSMQRGTSRSHAFRISNTGDKPLQLELGRASCKCTVGELAKNKLAPGEQVELDVEWKAQSEVGEFRQFVPVSTNDPRNTRVELSIVGQITEPTGLYPREFTFGKIPVGESRSATVYLMAYLQDSVEIEEAKVRGGAGQEYFDIEIESSPVEELPDENAAAGKEITVTAKDTLPMGQFTQWLELKTNIPEVEELMIPIMGRVEGDISIAGRGWSAEHGVLKLGRVLSSQGKSAELKIIVRGKQAADIEFEVASTDPPELQASLAEPKRYRDTLYHIPLTIEVPAGTRQMAHLNSNLQEPAQVVLKTTHPRAPELKLEVRFAVE